MKTRELDRSGLVSATDGMNDRLWRKTVIEVYVGPSFTLLMCVGRL
jgi:hypothetical protein